MIVLLVRDLAEELVVDEGLHAVFASQKCVKPVEFLKALVCLFEGREGLGGDVFPIAPNSKLISSLVVSHELMSSVGAQQFQAVMLLSYHTLD
jgi:hypothetical protein